MTLHSPGSGAMSIHFQVVSDLRTSFTRGWIYEQQNTRKFVPEYQHNLANHGAIYNPLRSPRHGLQMFCFIIDNMHSYIYMYAEA